MLIGIQHGLQGLRDELLSRGYHVTATEVCHHHMDIYLYDSKEVQGILSQGLDVSSEMVKKSRGGYGTIMVNIHNKSLTEIEYILHNRCYSALELY